MARLTNNKEMNIYLQNIWICLLGLLLLSTSLISCNNQDSEPFASEEETMEFYLDFPTRSVGKDDGSLDPLNDYFTLNESILLIGQRTQTQSLNFDDYGEDGAKNSLLYKYVWNGKEANESNGNSPNWETGYNFKPLASWGNILTASNIQAHGAFGNSYAFGALYYPVDNSQKSEIETDQSKLDALKKSNLLGTYHQAEIYTERLRFRLYHLMACLRVTILVPVSKTDEENGTTGYDERTITSTLLNLKKDFVIDWGNRASEEAPLLKEDETTNERADITMYPHPVTGDREIKNQDLSYFDMEGNDEVREYTFSGLFPPQTISKTDNILRFDVMQANSKTKVETSYYWSTSQLLTNIQMSPGTITNLVLYFPRGENNALLIKSEILDWNHADSTVTITPETSSSDI